MVNKTGIVLLSLGLLLLVGTFLISNFNGDLIQKKVECVVTVNNPLGSDLTIQASSCSAEKNFFCGGIPLVTQGFFDFLKPSFGSDTGIVKFNIGGEVFTQTIKVFEQIDTETVNADFCVNGNLDRGFVSVIDDQGFLVDSREVSF